MTVDSNESAFNASGVEFEEGLRQIDSYTYKTPFEKVRYVVMF